MTEQTKPFRVVQPWGPNRAKQSTVVSSHDTVVEAFGAIDAAAQQMARTGAPADAVELIVLNVAGNVVERRTS
jgi:hypothetical protein